jgi:hypothetical protein
LPKLKASQIWIISLVTLLAFRYLVGQLFTQGTIIGLLLYVVGFYFWVIPFIMGNDMSLIGYTGLFKKGRDDKARYILLIAGVFWYITALVA